MEGLSHPTKSFPRFPSQLERHFSMETTDNNNEDFVSRLPIELLSDIFLYLDDEQLAVASKVNKAWHSLLVGEEYDDIFWKKKALAHLRSIPVRQINHIATLSWRKYSILKLASKKININWKQFDQVNLEYLCDIISSERNAR
jgi:hypothetical protein